MRQPTGAKVARTRSGDRISCHNAFALARTRCMSRRKIDDLRTNACPCRLEAGQLAFGTRQCIEAFVRSATDNLRPGGRRDLPRADGGSAERNQRGVSRDRNQGSICRYDRSICCHCEKARETAAAIDRQCLSTAAAFRQSPLPRSNPRSSPSPMRQASGNTARSGFTSRNRAEDEDARPHTRRPRRAWSLLRSSVRWDRRSKRHGRHPSG